MYLDAYQVRTYPGIIYADLTVLFFCLRYVYLYDLFQFIVCHLLFHTSICFLLREYSAPKLLEPV